MGSFVALMGWLPAMALALVPPKLAYQGRLLDPTGAPVTGIQEIRFTIHDSASGGNVLWSEVQRLSLTDGYYATYLGAADSINLAKVFEESGDRYLSLTIGGAELLPRQSIASVPYAMTWMAGTMQASAFVRVTFSTTAIGTPPTSTAFGNTRAAAAAASSARAGPLSAEPSSRAADRRGAELARGLRGGFA